MIYDVHAHCVPAELFDLLRADGQRFDIEVAQDDQGRDSLLLAGRVNVGALPELLWDVDARIAAMDSAQVDVQLLSHRTDLSAYALRGDAGPRYARAFNDIMAAEVSRAPDRFLALGTVPLQNPEAAADELRRAVEDLGMVGVEIASSVDGTSLDQAGLEPFWEAAASLKCVVLLHPYAPLPGVDLGRYFLDNMVGRPAESTVAIGQLLFSGVLERHEDLVICLVHGGGFLPYQLGRWQKGFSVVPHITQQHISTPPRDLARRLYYDSLLHIPEALEYLVKVVGADRVVTGSDYPYEMHERQPVEAVRATSLDDHDKDLILSGNVARLLKEMAA